MRARALGLSIFLLGSAGLLAFLYEPVPRVAHPSSPSPPSRKLDFAAIDTSRADVSPPSPEVRPPTDVSFPKTEPVPPQPDHKKSDTLPRKSNGALSAPIFYSAPSADREIALTFDDGPHPTITPKVLDELRARNTKATFFVLGNRVKRYPWILQRIVAEGHEVGNHTWSHRFLANLSAESIEHEISETQNLIRQTTGVECSLFRPPAGILSAVAEKIIQKHNLSVILWSVDPGDWRARNTDRIYQSVIRHVQSGSIVVCHDIYPSTLRALPRILETLSEKGYRFSTVSQLCGLPKPPAATNP